MGKKFKQYDDGDYAKRFWRELAPQCFHLMWLQYAKEYDSSVDVEYWLELMEIDMAVITDLQLEEVAKSMGMEDPQWDRKDFWAADAVAEYGLKSPLLSLSGNNAKALIKEGRQHSYDLNDPAAHEEAMCAPVNQLGSTAREFFQGGNALHFAMVRGVAKGETSAKLMAKIHGAKDEEIEKVVGTPVPPPVQAVHASIDLHGISRHGQSNDPLAFSTGYMLALTGAGLPFDDRRKCAAAYVEGYRFGVDVRTGRLAKPAWHK